MKNNDTKRMSVSTTTRSFRRGLRELRVKDVEVVKAALAAELGVTTRQSFAGYRDGKRLLDVCKATAIEKIFARYGVSDPWGD